MPGGRFAAPDDLAQLAKERFGAMTVEIVIEDGAVVKSRIYKDRDRAWIVIANPHAIHPGIRRAIALHETGHLLRNDAVRYEVTQIFALTMVEVAVFTLSLPGYLLGLAAAVVLQLVGRWLAETACDAFAVRWAGGEGMAAWGRLQAKLLALPENRTARRRIRRALLGWLTHPPLPWRLARVKALVAKRLVS